MIDRIKGIINVEWEKIKPIQPDDVKINTNINALKKSLKKHGFSIPFAVWKDGSTIYTIDGHTRKRALEELKHEGEDVPDKLKAFEIDAKDRKEAVQILVEVFNQKHNAFDNEVLTRWLEVEDVEIQDLNVLNVANFIPETDFPDELTDDYKNKPASMKITFESIEQLQHAENDIQELLDRKYPNAYYSVNSGEL